MDGLGAELAPFVQLSALAALVMVLLITFRAVSRGDWLPRRIHEDIVAGYSARITEKETEIEAWRDVATTERTGREVAQEQAGQLLGVSGTLERTLDALRAASEGRPGEPR